MYQVLSSRGFNGGNYSGKTAFCEHADISLKETGGMSECTVHLERLILIRLCSIDPGQSVCECTGEKS
jgi:hypothetical protein